MHTITAKSPGRICLLGDNTDLIEEPALAAAISAYLTIELNIRDDHTIRLIGKDIGYEEEFNLGDPLRLDSPLRYVTAAYKRVEKSIPTGFDAKISSEIPISAGLSSSTALCITALRALSTAYNIPFTTAELAELAFQIENKDLQVECGRMDQYAIAYGGVTYINTGPEAGVEKLTNPIFPIVVADTEEKHDTKELQIWIRTRLKAREELLLGSLQRVVRIVQEGRSAILSGDMGKLGELMNRQQVEEKLMGTSTDRLEEFCRVARDAGAIGAKQMGAGGGGCMIALCPPGGVAAVKSRLESLGAPAWEFKIVEA